MKTVVWLVMMGVMAGRGATARAQHGAVHESTGEPVEVHITPSSTTPASSATRNSQEAGVETWSESGIDLKDLLAQLYDVDPERVELADAALAERRYDVEMTLPDEESEAIIDARIEAALKKKFHLSIAAESGPTDVYVMTAPKGAGAELKPDLKPVKSGGGMIDSQVMLEETATGKGTPSKEEIARLVAAKQAATGVSLTGIDMTGGTIADLCGTLERALERPVLDESGLTGEYEVDVKGYANRDELLAMLRERYGLVLMPERREVKFLVVRPE